MATNLKNYETCHRLKQKKKKKEKKKKKKRFMVTFSSPK